MIKAIAQTLIFGFFAITGVAMIALGVHMLQLMASGAVDASRLGAVFPFVFVAVGALLPIGGFLMAKDF